MNLKDRVNSINKDIQSFSIDNFNAINNSLFSKLDELKKVMVSVYEKNEGLNKYMIRIPMWLIDMNLMDFKKHQADNDRIFWDGIISNSKRATNKAIELFEISCIENNANSLLQEGF